MKKLAINGFTLIEVLVALSLFAVAAVVITSASMNQLMSYERVQEQTLARFVAHNAAVDMSLNQQWLEGDDAYQVEAQGFEWTVRRKSFDTVSEDVRRVEILITKADQTQDAGWIDRLVILQNRPNY